MSAESASLVMVLAGLTFIVAATYVVGDAIAYLIIEGFSVLECRPP